MTIILPTTAVEFYKYQHFILLCFDFQVHFQTKDQSDWSFTRQKPVNPPSGMANFGSHMPGHNSAVLQTQSCIFSM